MAFIEEMLIKQMRLFLGVLIGAGDRQPQEEEAQTLYWYLLGLML